MRSAPPSSIRERVASTSSPCPGSGPAWLTPCGPCCDAVVKVAYAIARYGVELRAGAELGTRMLAEHLVADRGCDVEVFTTCAREMSTWADDYEPGTSVVNGVTVHRFRSVSGRASGFERFSDGVMHRPAATSPADAERWVELQGPVCPDVLDAAAASDADVVVFY